MSNLQSLTYDLSSQIKEGKGTLGKLVKDEALYNTALAAVTNLEGTAVEVRQTVADARKIVDQVNSGQGTVGKLLKDEALYRETTASVTSLKEILQKINQGTGTVGKLINDQEFYKNAKMSLQKLDKATEGLEDQGPLSVMGILVNYLF
jgi:phospholipid/cholesterol/gamma-HCH transport system substrate-binding protein